MAKIHNFSEVANLFNNIEFAEVHSYARKEFEAFIELEDDIFLIINSLTDEVYIENQIKDSKIFYDKNNAKQFLREATDWFEARYENEIEDDERENRIWHSETRHDFTKKELAL